MHRQDIDTIRARSGDPAPARASLRLVLASMVLALVTACGDSSANSRAAVVLIDISGNYAGEIDKARLLSRFLLADLSTGDSLAIAFIDNSSYSERNFITRVDFDRRPSVANDQKRKAQADLDAFLERFSVPSAHSDITGGVLLARDFLADRDVGRKQLFLLSNLEEDLHPELERDAPLGLDGIEVIAVNVTRQRSDNINPLRYQQRVQDWQERVRNGGGEWQIVADLNRLESALARR